MSRQRVQELLAAAQKQQEAFNALLHRQQQEALALGASGPSRTGLQGAGDAAAGGTGDVCSPYPSQKGVAPASVHGISNGLLHELEPNAWPLPASQVRHGVAPPPPACPGISVAQLDEAQPAHTQSTLDPTLAPELIRSTSGLSAGSAAAAAAPAPAPAAAGHQPTKAASASMAEGGSALSSLASAVELEQARSAVQQAYSNLAVVTSWLDRLPACLLLQEPPHSPDALPFEPASKDCESRSCMSATPSFVSAASSCAMQQGGGRSAHAGWPQHTEHGGKMLHGELTPPAAAWVHAVAPAEAGGQLEGVASPPLQLLWRPLSGLSSQLSDEAGRATGHCQQRWQARRQEKGRQCPTVRPATSSGLQRGAASVAGGLKRSSSATSAGGNVGGSRSLGDGLGAGGGRPGTSSRPHHALQAPHAKGRSGGKAGRS
jgi:hypothetical protein